LVAGSQFRYDEYYPGGVYRKEYVDQLDALGYGLSGFILANPYFNTTWQFVENANYYPASVKVPCFMVGGWYDHNIESMLQLFSGIRMNSPANVKDKHKLLMGPWAHGGFGQAQVGTCTQGELIFNEACGWSDSLALRFFDYYLKNQSNGWDSEPVIRYFDIGENNWKTTLSWPPAGFSIQKFYLHPGGLLSTTIPVTTNSFSNIIYDPADPSPTHGGPTLRQDQLQGPYDQSQVVETRSDILLFTSAPLQTTYTIAGKPVVHLFVKSDRKDTDFAVRFCDVYPDGRSMLISDGIFRMRFRNGFTTADTSSMVAGQIYEVDVELPDVSYSFLSGHSIRVDISSSNYPRFDNNLNNGGVMYNGGPVFVASNQVYHESVHNSYIQLPASINNSLNFANSMDYIFEIYPNPTGNKIFVNWDSSEEKYLGKIINVLGLVVKESVLMSGEQVELSDLPDGVYLLSLYSNKDLLVSKKIMIERALK
jgi:putative CocE/NonD family hydrolase